MAVSLESGANAGQIILPDSSFTTGLDLQNAEFFSKRPLTLSADRQDARWNEYVGQVWGDVLCEMNNFDRSGTVLEVGPGGCSKVGIGLQKLDFDGELYFIEPDPDANIKTLINYTGILKDARVTAVCRHIENAGDELPRSLDTLLGNHIFDDLILHHSLKGESSGDAFQDLYSIGSDRTFNIWRSLRESQHKQEECVLKCVETLSGFIQSRNFQNVILSQYRSNFFTSIGFELADDLANRASDILCEKLLTSGFNESKLAKIQTRNRLPDSNWIILEKCSPFPF